MNEILVCESRTANIWLSVKNVKCHVMFIENSLFFQSSKGDFDWSSTEQGQILGALFYGNIISQIPAGILAELIGGKMIFGLGIFASSIMTLLTPTLAHHSFFSLIVCRTLIGFAQVKTIILFILIRVFCFLISFCSIGTKFFPKAISSIMTKVKM